MSIRFKTTLAVLLALVMAFAAFPVLAIDRVSEAKAAASPRWTVPSGYNANDYDKCAAFLEQTDENGVKNGEKLSASYDVNDPSSWGASAFQWAQTNGEMRIWIISVWQQNDLVGNLDVSNCSALFQLDLMDNNLSALDISGCTELRYLDCSGNELTALDVSDSTGLMMLYCDKNHIAELDVSMLSELIELDCFDNELSEIDVSNCPDLEAFYCTGNRFTELDLSNNPKLGLDYLSIEGSGTIGYRFLIDNGELHARPASGVNFEGFFDESGNLLDEGFFIDEDDAYVYYISGLEDGNIVARFTGGSTAVPGDIDGSGSVAVSDAVTALRYAMQLIDGTGLDLETADLDGSGSVTIADAVVILRMAMGLV